MNSLFSLVETLAALVFDPTYSAMYARTVSLFAGTVYLFSGFMILPAIGIMTYVNHYYLFVTKYFYILVVKNFRNL